MDENKTINKSFATVNVMKVVATVFVLYIHGANVFGYSNHEMPQYLFPLKALFSCAVPAFMTVSGFLLFKKPLRFCENMKKKTRRLAIPFFIWSIFWVIFEMIGHVFMPDKFTNVLAWNLEDLVMGVIGVPFYRGPLYGPLWYVRDLFLLSVLAPLIERLVRKYPSIFFCFATVLWFVPLNLHLREAVCFFFIGASIACLRVSDKLVRIIDYKIGVLFLAIGIIGSAFLSSWIMERISTIVFLGFVYIFTKTLSKNKKTELLCDRNVRYTFFIYLVHGKILSIIQILYVAKFPSKSAAIIGYLAIPLLLFFCCLGLAILFKRLLPRLFSFCNGETIRGKSQMN